MRILAVNRNFFLSGGPEKYWFSLMNKMPQHEFIPFCVNFERNNSTPYEQYFVSPPAGGGHIHFKDFKLSLRDKVAYACKSIYSLESRNNLDALIRETRPDVALFLNAVYFTDSIIDACRKNHIPIIWRMSDFHKLCSSYLLFRDGRICEECLSHGLSRAVVNRCGGYQRSTAAAVIKAASMWISKVRGAYKHVDYLVTPSAFTRQKLIEGGFLEKKVIHIPTFIEPAPYIPLSPEQKPMILYVGRLSHEKGINTLLEAFALTKSNNANLFIVGDDTTTYAKQLKSAVPKAIHDQVTFLGFQNQEQILKLYRQCTCFVVPSLWYENQPNVVLEGMSQARPVIASDLGSMSEMVVNGRTGYLFEAGNACSLAEKLNSILQHPHDAAVMGQNARVYVMENHSVDNHINALDKLIEQVCRHAS